MTTSKSEVSGEFTAELTDVTTWGALEVGQFVDIPAHAGNVGICLSGGGSQARCAGMGNSGDCAPSRGALTATMFEHLEI